MASFWFEERGTESYYKVTSWDKPSVPATKEEFEQKELGDRIFEKLERTPLERVDELICEFMGEPTPSRDRDSDFYFWCHDVGFWTLFKLGGTHIGDKPEHLPALHVAMDEWMDRILERYVSDEDDFLARFKREGYRARCHALIDWVFVTKWRFGASG